MFVKRCSDTNPHPEHIYTQHWIKADLIPHLRNSERYPDEWDAEYRCPGLADTESE